MLRLQTEHGWWLVTHPDHASLAGHFAALWGNALFRSPEPRNHVLHAIAAHDDGWFVPDRTPRLTSAGIPAAFSRELVGKYSAFEEIDLEAYLAVRRNAVDLIAQTDPYAAILISMHTHNLLSARADRSTIAPVQLPTLDAFLAAQQALQHTLFATLPSSQQSWPTLQDNFRLLQACDNLSLLACTDYPAPATLLHPLPTHTGAAIEIQVTRTAERTFTLTPYPFTTPTLTIPLTARFLPHPTFATRQALQSAFGTAIPQQLSVTCSPSP